MNNVAFALVPCIIIKEDGYLEPTAKNIEAGFKRYMLDQVGGYPSENIQLISLSDTLELMREKGADEEKVEEARMLIKVVDNSIEQHDGICIAIEENLCNAYFPKSPKIPEEKVTVYGERIVVMPLGQNVIKKNVVPSLK